MRIVHLPYMGCMLVTHVSHVWVCTYTYPDICIYVYILVHIYVHSSICTSNENIEIILFVFFHHCYSYITVHFLEMFLLGQCVAPLSGLCLLLGYHNIIPYTSTHILIENTFVQQKVANNSSMALFSLVPRLSARGRVEQSSSVQPGEPGDEARHCVARIKSHWPRLWAS